MSNSLVRIQPNVPAALAIAQREFPEYHPVLALVRLAHRADVFEKDPRLELEIHKTVLPYVSPRLSSVEVKDARDEDRRILVSLFEERELEDGRIVEVEVPLVTEIEDVVELDS